MVKVPCVRGGGTTPEPPGKGPGRDPPVTVGHKRPDVRSVLPGVLRFGVTLRALRDGQLFPAPPKIPSGFARPVFRSARLTVVLLPGAPRFWQAGWNRGTYVSPLNHHQGWGFFIACPRILGGIIMAEENKEFSFENPEYRQNLLAQEHRGYYGRS